MLTSPETTNQVILTQTSYFLATTKLHQVYLTSVQLRPHLQVLVLNSAGLVLATLTWRLNLISARMCELI